MISGLNWIARLGLVRVQDDILPFAQLLYSLSYMTIFLVFQGFILVNGPPFRKQWVVWMELELGYLLPWGSMDNSNSALKSATR